LIAGACSNLRVSAGDKPEIADSRDPIVRRLICNWMGTARGAQEGLAMSKMSGRSFAAVVSVLTIGAALSFGATRAVAAEDVTEDQILRALAPAKKPVTRGLSAGPQANPAATAAEGRLVEKIRGRATRSLSVSEREEIASIAKDKPNIDLEITFDYNSAEISSKSLPSVQALGRVLSNSVLKG